ncbi:EAL domain-containing protein [Lacticaseibacillus pantheris]|uniref:EAL domain-containing protein n=1 Tax=Lacticaseibacillus pantheris TaxID=171523 RepID=UPI00265B391C|nr:EAL domain-containing protein [Lacticaseibacillus pantheris]WKF84302.1 EAL domain-containing protein [Lacticaseibacillus pantheris]
MVAGTDEGENTFFAQPIINIDTGATMRYELLLRERRPDGWHLPSLFGLSFVEARRLLLAALTHLDVKQIDLNLTAAQFANARFINRLVELKLATPELVHMNVELTGTPSIVTLQQMGVLLSQADIHVTIDDVGSDNLRMDVVDLFPFIDNVKFAMQNVRHPGSCADVEAQVGYWKRLADEHHLHFTLGGIESHADVDVAEQLGITEGQGFYFGRPVIPQ